MARLLVNAKPGPRRGEVVVWRPDGHVWGTKEVLPDFVHIDVTDLTLPEIAKTRLRPLVTAVQVRNLENGKLDQRARRRFCIRKALVQRMADRGRQLTKVTEAELYDMVDVYENDGTREKRALRLNIERKAAEMAAGSETI